MLSRRGQEPDLHGDCGVARHSAGLPTALRVLPRRRRHLYAGLGKRRVAGSARLQRGADLLEHGYRRVPRNRASQPRQHRQLRHHFRGLRIGREAPEASRMRHVLLQRCDRRAGRLECHQSRDESLPRWRGRRGHRHEHAQLRGLHSVERSGVWRPAGIQLPARRSVSRPAAALALAAAAAPETTAARTRQHVRWLLRRW